MVANDRSLCNTSDTSGSGGARTSTNTQLADRTFSAKWSTIKLFFLSTMTSGQMLAMRSIGS